jgi:hypothetical protein
MNDLSSITLGEKQEPRTINMAPSPFDPNAVEAVAKKHGIQAGDVVPFLNGAMYALNVLGEILDGAEDKIPVKDIEGLQAAQHLRWRFHTDISNDFLGLWGRR